MNRPDRYDLRLLERAERERKASPFFGWFLLRRDDRAQELQARGLLDGQLMLGRFGGRHRGFVYRKAYRITDEGLRVLHAHKEGKRT